VAESERLDEMELWRSFAQTFRAVQKVLDAKLKVVGVGYQEFKVLGELVSGGRTPMARLADKIMFTQAGVTYLIDRLEEQGYVMRVRSSEDRRIIYVEATEKGRKVFEQGVKVVQETSRKIFESLKPEELEALGRVLLKIRENVEAAALEKQT